MQCVGGPLVAVENIEQVTYKTYQWKMSAQKDFFEHGWNIGWLKPTSSHTK